MGSSNALLTDRYELTMLDATIRAGLHERACQFEVFARSLPPGRRFGVVAGAGRLLSLLAEFRFGDEELGWLSDAHVVGDATLEYLAGWRFSGDIKGYREGELYFPNSPILSVQAPFGEGVLLETLVLSVLNYDSAVASAAARMRIAADGRPLAEMGSRRTGERSAVAAARAAYIAGFWATSNLEAGRTWGVPTMGTAAHAFTLLFDSERDAFTAQLEALGKGTTLLVDTYDIEQAVRTAVDLAGPALGSVRIDSGDLPSVVGQVRSLLDRLGNEGTRITVTNDLDEFSIAALAASPVDSYGVGTSVVTGSGSPASGMVYKLVARTGDTGEWVPVAKRSAHKATVGGRKSAYRLLMNGSADRELVLTGDAVTPRESRPLEVPLVRDGVISGNALGVEGVRLAREHHLAVAEELPDEGRRLSAGGPAIPTEYC